MSNSSRANRSKRRKESQEFNNSQNLSNQIQRLYPKTKNQDRLINSIKQNHISIASGPAGVGKSLIALHEAIWLLEKGIIDKILYTKPTVNFLEQKGIGFIPGPQPLYSKVLTPSGWVQHKDLKIGNLICTPDGQTVPILNIYKKGIKEVYKVHTTNGSVTECCLDHLWSVNTQIHNNKFNIMDTETIMKGLKNKIKYRLPSIKTVNFNENYTPIPPYLLGALLGDGGFSDSHVSFYNMDQEIIQRVKKEAEQIGSTIKKQKNSNIGYRLVTKNKRTFYNNSYTAEKKGFPTLVFDNAKTFCNYFNLTDSALRNKLHEQRLIKGYKINSIRPNNCKQNPIRKELFNLGLGSKSCYHKFIPDIYKYNSVEVRLEILRGLMDTDGTCKQKGEASFETTSLKLAEDMIEIIKSLGGSAKLRTRNPRKSVKILGKKCNSVTSYCFNVSLPNQYNPFFLKRKADRFNSKFFKHNYITNIEKVSEEECQCILIDHSDHLYITDDYIVTHNTIEEKLLPLMFPLLDNLEVFVSSGKIKYMLDKKQIEFQLLEYVRGRSLRNTFVICDEFQSVSPLGALTMISRIESTSKLVILGDPKQADIKLKSNALEDSIYRLKGAQSTGIIQFSKEDIVRSSFLKDVISRYDHIA